MFILRSTHEEVVKDLSDANLRLIDTNHRLRARLDEVADINQASPLHLDVSYMKLYSVERAQRHGTWFTLVVFNLLTDPAGADLREQQYRISLSQHETLVKKILTEGKSK
jgi:hypothetical protein